MHGKGGKYECADYSYNGEFVEDQKSGKGKATFKIIKNDIKSYDGMWLKDQPSGDATKIEYKNGSSYKG